MTPSQLRLWMQKYGNWGVLVVAAYLGLRALWKMGRHMATVGLLVVGFGGLLILSVKQSRAPLPSHVTVLPHYQPVPSVPAHVHERFVPETLVDSRVIRAESDQWRLEIWSPGHREDETGFSLDATEEYLKIFKNDRLIRTSHAEELGPEHTLEFGKPTFVTRFPLITIRLEPECGNPSAIDLFSIRHGAWVTVGQIGGEFGGPLFRDFDGDGKREWIFDDYDFYTHTGKPTHFLVYKEASDGKLTWVRSVSFGCLRSHIMAQEIWTRKPAQIS